MHTVVETAEFQKQAKSMERCGPRSIHRRKGGDVIWGREKGWGGEGRGRVIYFHLTDDEIVLLVMVYAKAAQANVKPSDIKRG